jgi:3-deoxy-manno-octulosonate cytidylyltransferase (CMP-KDO synthetase)
MSSNVVKVVTDKIGRALYFSRQAIPFHRNLKKEDWADHGNYLKHIGIYLFSSSVLTEIISLSPSELEMAEQLEQLRWLDHGLQIHTVLTEHESVGIDTPEDLQRAILFLENN